MTEKILRFRWLIIAVMVLAFVPKMVQAQNTVTLEPPNLVNGYYQIANAGNLYWFAKEVNSGNTSICAVLTQNITVNTGGVLKEDGSLISTNPTEELIQWTPIGDISHKYSGTFDGQGNTISGLYCDVSDNYVGLFGCIEKKAQNIPTIRNVGVIDSYIKGNEFVGGVCGKNGGNGGGIIENCYNTGMVSGNWHIGGVCGYNISSSTINNCYNAGFVSGTEVGGVCGRNGNGCIIEKCYNTGVVSGTDTYAYVGGVCGDNYYGTITNSYNTGQVSGIGYIGVYIGGVCGENSEGAITNCYNMGEIGYENNANVGGVCGYKSSGTITNCYYLTNGNNSPKGIGNGKDAVGSVEGKDPDKFTNGSVTWQLNGNTIDDSTTPEKTLPWLLNKDVDASPVLKANTANGVCPIVVKDGDDYRNDNSHSYNELAANADAGTQNLYSYHCTKCNADNKKVIKNLTKDDDADIEIIKNGTEPWKTTSLINLTAATYYDAPVEFTTTGEVSYTRNMSGNRWATICLPYTVNTENEKCKFYELSGVDESKITLTEITETATIAAGKPVFVKANDGVTEITFSATGETKMLKAPTTGSTAGDYTLTGAFELTTLPQSSGDLFIKNDKMWDVRQVGDKEMKVKIFRAYLKNKGSVKAGAPQRSLAVDGEATAISDALDTLNDTNAEYYDMSGRRISSLQKGVNIIKSGNRTRKVIIK